MMSLLQATDRAIYHARTAGVAHSAARYTTPLQTIPTPYYDFRVQIIMCSVCAGSGWKRRYARIHEPSTCETACGHIARLLDCIHEHCSVRSLRSATCIVCVQ